jgi:hypothetical protein
MTTRDNTFDAQTMLCGARECRQVGGRAGGIAAGEKPLAPGCAQTTAPLHNARAYRQAGAHVMAPQTRPLHCQVDA